MQERLSVPQRNREGRYPVAHFVGLLPQIDRALRTSGPVPVIDTLGYGEVTVPQYIKYGLAMLTGEMTRFDSRAMGNLLATVSDIDNYALRLQLAKRLSLGSDAFPPIIFTGPAYRPHKVESFTPAGEYPDDDLAAIMSISGAQLAEREGRVVHAINRFSEAPNLAYNAFMAMAYEIGAGKGMLYAIDMYTRLQEDWSTTMSDADKDILVLEMFNNLRPVIPDALATSLLADGIVAAAAWSLERDGRNVAGDYDTLVTNHNGATFQLEIATAAEARAQTEARRVDDAVFRLAALTERFQQATQLQEVSGLRREQHSIGRNRLALRNQEVIARARLYGETDPQTRQNLSTVADMRSSQRQGVEREIAQSRTRIQGLLVDYCREAARVFDTGLADQERTPGSFEDLLFDALTAITQDDEGAKIRGEIPLTDAFLARAPYSTRVLQEDQRYQGILQTLLPNAIHGYGHGVILGNSTHFSEMFAQLGLSEELNESGTLPAAEMYRRSLFSMPHILHLLIDEVADRNTEFFSSTVNNVTGAVTHTELIQAPDVIEKRASLTNLLLTQLCLIMDRQLDPQGKHFPFSSRYIAFIQQNPEFLRSGRSGVVLQALRTRFGTPQFPELDIHAWPQPTDQQFTDLSARLRSDQVHAQPLLIVDNVRMKEGLARVNKAARLPAALLLIAGIGIAAAGALPGHPWQQLENRIGTVRAFDPGRRGEDPGALSELSLASLQPVELGQFVSNPDNAKGLPVIVGAREISPDLTFPGEQGDATALVDAGGKKREFVPLENALIADPQQYTNTLAGVLQFPGNIVIMPNTSAQTQEGLYVVPPGYILVTAFTNDPSIKIAVSGNVYLRFSGESSPVVVLERASDGLTPYYEDPYTIPRDKFSEATNPRLANVFDLLNQNADRNPGVTTAFRLLLTTRLAELNAIPAGITDQEVQRQQSQILQGLRLDLQQFKNHFIHYDVLPNFQNDQSIVTRVLTGDASELTCDPAAVFGIEMGSILGMRTGDMSMFRLDNPVQTMQGTVGHREGVWILPDGSAAFTGLTPMETAQTSPSFKAALEGPESYARYLFDAKLGLANPPQDAVTGLAFLLQNPGVAVAGIGGLLALGTSIIPLLGRIGGSRGESRRGGRVAKKPRLEDIAEKPPAPGAEYVPIINQQLLLLAEDNLEDISDDRIDSLIKASEDAARRDVFIDPDVFRRVRQLPLSDQTVLYTKRYFAAVRIQTFLEARLVAGRQLGPVERKLLEITKLYAPLDR